VLALELYPYQKLGHNRLINSATLLLADEMGLGKTPQALSAAESLHSSGAIRRTLVVCPASLLVNWKHEACAWAPSLPGVLYRGEDRHGLLGSNAKLLITSYETIASDLWDESRSGELFVDIGIDLLVLDEAQRIKNPDSRPAKVLRKLCAARRWALTGTPLENRPSELGSVLGVLRPNESEYLVSTGGLPEVLRQRDQLMLRRTKKDAALELPPKTVGYIRVEMTAEQRAEYDEVLTSLRERVHDGLHHSESNLSLLATLNQLRLLAASSSSGSSGKLSYLEELLDTILVEPTKAIIFSSFPNKVFPHLEHKLERFGVVQYSGNMSIDDREESHRSFVENPEAQVMLASLRAAGTGLTWTSASHVFHMDLWWNPQALNQAEARAHRIGQVQPVVCQRLVCDSSVDEGIVELLHRKVGVFDTVVESDDVPKELANRSTLLGLIEGAVS